MTLPERKKAKKDKAKSIIFINLRLYSPNDSRADKKRLVKDKKKRNVFVILQNPFPITDKEHKVC